MESMNLKVATAFSTAPGPRYIFEGERSGELFRKTVLFPYYIKALEGDSELIIDLDGTAGFGTSFLEESFGGLIRENNADYNDLLKRLKFVSTEEEYLIADIMEYMSDANDKKQINDQQ